MWKAPRHSLYTLLLTLLFLTAVSSIAAFAIKSIEKETKRQIRNSLQTVLQTTVTTYQTWIEYREKGIEQLAASTALIEMTRNLLATEGDKQRILTSLRQLMSTKLAQEQDQGFFIISPQRLSIASMRDANLYSINLIHSQRPDYLNRAFNGETLFVPTLLSDVPLEGSSHSIFIVSPIRQEGRIIAVLALRISPNDFFTRVIELARLGRTGETYAFDKYGMLITKSRFDHQLHDTGLIDPAESDILNIRITDPGGNLLEGYTAMIPPQDRPLTMMADSATRGHSGYNIDGYRDYRGVPVFGAWLWDHSLGFGFATEVDVDEALDPFYQTRRTVIGVISIIIVLALSLLAYAIQAQRTRKRYLQQAHDTLEQRVQERTRELNAAKLALEAANRELEVLATTDGLTGVANRRSFDRHLKREWLHCRRLRKSLGIILLDIDYFKNYNDHYGHQHGDECLRSVADILRALNAVRRPGDIIARYGGEEFVIVLSDPTIEYVSKIANNLRQQIFQLGIEHLASPLPDKVITISVGYAVASDLDRVSINKLVKLADTALFEAKSLGRNQVVEMTI
ncbi:MAG: diguanylate cyclase [Amphritea sp.]